VSGRGGQKIFIVFTSCSARKDDSVSIPNGSRVVEPSYYLDQPLVLRLLDTRGHVFQDRRSCVSTKTAYAFDLYVRVGRAYKNLLESNYHRLKPRLLSGDFIEWFFLSGGYGIVHALEEVGKYQATFNRNIAYQNKIPYTANLWKPLLTQICDSVVARFNPDFVYVFGSRDYTEFIKQTSFWKKQNRVRMFESTGSSGPTWLSPILNEFVGSILQDNVDAFNSKYDKFTKQ
jgi:hypothetical protein